MNRMQPRSENHEQVYHVLRSARGLMMTAYKILMRFGRKASRLPPCTAH